MVAKYTPRRMQFALYRGSIRPDSTRVRRKGTRRPEKSNDESEHTVNHMRIARHVRIGLALALVLAIGAIAGCTSNNKTDSSTGEASATAGSAKTAYGVAISSLSTKAPDGKLLVCQAADTITPTSTPVWEFLIGSPKTNAVWAVLVREGKAEASEYGSADLSADEWKAVPEESAWKVDSPQAYDSALKVYPNGKTADYFMGFVTYIPKSAQKENTTKPMTWIVSFDPTSKGTAATSTVNVDMGTGTATLAK
jgi:hypothetical protein